MGITTYPGITELSTFKSNADPLPGKRGQVPAPPVGTPADYVLQASGIWGPGGNTSNVVFVPVIRFVGSQTGGVGQTFTNSNLSYYSLAEDIDLFLDPDIPTGLRLAGGLTADDAFTLLGSTITVNYELPPGMRIFIDSKVIISGMIVTNYYLTEEGNRMLTEDDVNLLTIE